MNEYKVGFSTYNATDASNVAHRAFTFKSDLDILGAGDEALSMLYDKYQDQELLFRSIELTNAKEVYERVRDEKTTEV